MTQPTAAERVLEKVAKAHRIICDLAAGKHRWQMCVPPQKDDSDMVLQAPLDIIPQLLELAQRQNEALIKVKCFADHGRYLSLSDAADVSMENHELVSSVIADFDKTIFELGGG